MNRTLILKVLLAYAALSHLLIGLAAIVVPPGDLADSILQIAYGSTLEIDPTARHIIRILGVFMMSLGVLTALAVRDPQRYIGVIYALVLVFVIRTLQRIVFADEIQENFGISSGRLIGQSLFMITHGLVLVLLRPRRDAALK